jgi:hypothetical protein
MSSRALRTRRAAPDVAGSRGAAGAAGGDRGGWHARVPWCRAARPRRPHRRRRPRRASPRWLAHRGQRAGPAVPAAARARHGAGAAAVERHPVLDGQPLAVTGDVDGTVRIWDLATRTPIGDPLTGHDRRVNAVACTVLDGRPVAVTGGDDGTVRICVPSGGVNHARPPADPSRDDHCRRTRRPPQTGRAVRTLPALSIRQTRQSINSAVAT